MISPATLIPPDAYRRMTWRNGGGMTEEIAAAPGPSGFLWRLSIAEIGADGPFSAFPGVDRLIGVIAGEGIRLRFRDRPPATLRRLDRPLHFRGEAAPQCTLLDGPTRDVNLMFDRSSVSGDLAFLRGPATRHLAFDPGSAALVLALDGTITVTRPNGSVLPVPRGATAHLSPPGCVVRLADGAAAAVAAVAPVLVPASGAL